MLVELVSIQTGRVRACRDEQSADSASDSWTSAIFKTPVSGSVEVGALGIAGDEQADSVHHGGLDKAILCYSADHFSAWIDDLGVDVVPYGGFGENLTLSGASESTVCLGDRWRFGDVEIEVSQPRQPCWKLGRRWRNPDLARRVIATGRTGWYGRVVMCGQMFAPTHGELLDRPFPDWPVRRANEVFYARPRSAEAVGRLATLPVLSAAWKTQLTRMD